MQKSKQTSYFEHKSFKPLFLWLHRPHRPGPHTQEHATSSEASAYSTPNRAGKQILDPVPVPGGSPQWSETLMPFLSTANFRPAVILYLVFGMAWGVFFSQTFPSYVHRANHVCVCVYLCAWGTIYHPIFIAHEPGTQGSVSRTHILILPNGLCAVFYRGPKSSKPTRPDLPFFGVRKGPELCSCENGAPLAFAPFSSIFFTKRGAAVLEDVLPLLLLLLLLSSLVFIIYWNTANREEHAMFFIRTVELTAKNSTSPPRTQQHEPQHIGAVLSAQEQRAHENSFG